MLVQMKSAFLTIVCNSFIRFLVDAQTGQITLAKALDFETQQEYGLTYMATDGGDLSTFVAFRVAVLDFNDQGPIFPIDQYDSIITESSTKLNPNITVSVSSAWVFGILFYVNCRLGV